MGFFRTRRGIVLLIVLLPVLAGLAVFVSATVVTDAPVSVYVGGPPNTSADLDRESIERTVHRRINRARVDTDREPLDHNSSLRTIARYHGQRMATLGFVGHEGPDGVDLSDRYERFGVDCGGIGENVHHERIRTRAGIDPIGLRKGVTNERVADEIVDGWRSSPAHWENLLDRQWERGGVGVHLVQNGSFLDVYATHNFCNPDGSVVVTIEQRGRTRARADTGGDRN